MSDIAKVLAQLAEGHVDLRLETHDIALLVLVVDRCERLGRPTLPDVEMRALFVEACDAVSAPFTRPSQSAGPSLDALVQQRLLMRVDAGGLTRTPEFTVTALGQAVARFYIDEERLTAERLSALLQTILASLAAVRAAAATAADATAWRISVAIPLDTQVSELIAAIERRNRGLSKANEQMRARVTAIIKTDWYTGVGQCEELLRTTADTLAELKNILLTDGSRITAILGEISDVARAADQETVTQACRRAAQQVERIEAWSEQAYDNWSAFYRQIQEYIRAFVRLDPGRVVESRMTEIARAWMHEPWYLLVAVDEPLRYVRHLAQDHRPGIVSCAPQVDAEIIERQAPVDDVGPLVAEALAQGAETLAGVVTWVLPHLAPDRRYAAIGQIATLVADHLPSGALDEPAWISVEPGIWVEDLRLSPSKGAL